MMKLKESTSSLSKSNGLIKLPPYLDEDKLLRVGGRLETAYHLPHDTRHPVVLYSSHHITELIIGGVDWKHQHRADTNHLATKLLTKFWIVHVVQAVKWTWQRCNSCQQRRNIATTPIAHCQNSAQQNLGEHLNESEWTMLVQSWHGKVVAKCRRSATCVCFLVFKHLLFVWSWYTQWQQLVSYKPSAGLRITEDHRLLWFQTTGPTSLLRRRS